MVSVVVRWAEALCNVRLKILRRLDRRRLIVAIRHEQKTLPKD